MVAKITRRGFLDVIYDCPLEIEELTTGCPVFDLMNELDENRKEILYYWVVRQWSPQKIAAMRGQINRNIRKVYNKMIRDIRGKIFELIYPKYLAEEPLTLTQMLTNLIR